MTFVYLNPITWTQSIRRYPTIDVNGLYLTAQCTTKSGLILSDLEISLSFLRGALPEKDREKTKLLDGAIGGVWWNSDDNFVHGWLYLPDEDYVALWEQIKRGDYIDCDVSLGTASDSVNFIGNEFAWNGNPISVDSVEIKFKRKAITQGEKENSKTKSIKAAPLASSNRCWAVILILTDAAMWYSPENGFLFEPLKDFTAGDARISSTILLVGGLLLWFIRR